MVNLLFFLKNMTYFCEIFLQWFTSILNTFLSSILKLWYCKIQVSELIKLIKLLFMKFLYQKVLLIFLKFHKNMRIFFHHLVDYFRNVYQYVAVLMLFGRKLLDLTVWLVKRTFWENTDIENNSFFGSMRILDLSDILK